MTNQHEQDYESDSQHGDENEEEIFDENEIEHIVETLSVIVIGIAMLSLK
jgi:hypothetical protein